MNCWQVHAYIIGHLKDQMPAIIGKKSCQNRLIQKLSETYIKIQHEKQISPGDFPNIRRMQELLKQQDFTKFPCLKQKSLDAVDLMMEEDVARLMQMIPKDDEVCKEIPVIKGGAFNGYIESPFGLGKGEGIDRGKGESDWIVLKDRHRYEEIFQSLRPVNGKISGNAAKAEMMKSKLTNAVLGKVWNLADVDNDGMLDIDEFGLALHLIDVKIAGHELPNELPKHLIPPSKRHTIDD